MSQPVLAASGLRKRFGGLVATADVSFAVRDRTIVAIVGPNGAGKTTLMHQLAGTLRPDAGTISFKGRDITATSPSERVRLGIARTFQITALCPQLTAIEHVLMAVQRRQGSPFRFWRRATAAGPAADAALRCLAQTGLRDRAHDTPASLSYGEQRQLEMAIALGCGPGLLLLDEPLAGVGHVEAQRIIALIASLRADLPIVLIEHDMDAVFALADEIIVLHGGAVIAQGPPGVVAADPLVQEAYLGTEADA